MKTLVVKVGGSLLSQKELPVRLQRLLDGTNYSCVIVIVGGGPLVDELRKYADTFQLDDSFCHWQAIRLMSENAAVIDQLLTDFVLTKNIPSEKEARVLLDISEWAKQHSTLPKNWDTTSDSLAAELSCHVQADELWLLKSKLPASSKVADWNTEGLVDKHFVTAADHLKVTVFDLTSDNSLSVSAE